MKQKLTQLYLKECLVYDPETGIFTWKERPLHHFKDGKRHQTKEVKQKTWNKVFSNNKIKTVNTDGYVVVRIDDILYLCHRLAFLYMEGYIPEHQVDHIDQNKSNNMWSNLRHVSRSCNLQNCKIRTNNKTGVTGVCWDKSDNKWLSYISIKNNQKRLGSFINLDDAVLARYNEEQNNIGWSCSVESSAYKYLKKNGLI